MRRIIFAEMSGTCRAPMAESIMVDALVHSPDAIEVLSRGLVVLFEEPINPKAQAVLMSNGIDKSDYTSRQLLASEVNDETVVYVMDSREYVKACDIVGKDRMDQIFILSEAVGEELEIMDPYGAPLPSYGICYESMSKTIKKLALML